MASSFLLARLTRLNLALQRRKGRKGLAKEKGEQVLKNHKIMGKNLEEMATEAKRHSSALILSFAAATCSNGATEVNGNVQKNKQEQQEGQENRKPRRTAGPRGSFLLFLPFLPFLLAF